MSLLQERLNRLKRSSEEAKTGIKQVADTKRISLTEKWRKLGVTNQDNQYGNFLLKEIRYPLNEYCGKYRLGQLEGQAGVLGQLNKTAIMNTEHDKLLFFDTETTGLGSGAGNVAFMIGLGFYTQDEFVVEQLFIQNPGEELAMLFYLQDKFKGFTYLVTYNGKTFDWPIILNRYVMHRMTLKNNLLQHLDLLYPSRSLWKHTLPSCRLSNVEEYKLGIKRVEDVPGSLAPALYFQYLAEGDPQIVDPVFLHNECDILALAGLAIHLSTILNGNLKLEEMNLEEVFRLGLWLDKLGKGELAETIFEFIINMPPEKNRSYLYALASLYKKKRNYARAVQLWENHIADYGITNPLMPSEPFIELAMYYEHHKKDINTAQKYAQEALERARKRKSLIRDNTKQALAYDKLQKRLDRLSKKKAVQSRNENVLQLEWQP